MESPPVALAQLGAAWAVERRDDRSWFVGRAASDTPLGTVSATGDALWRRWSRHPLGRRDAFTCRGDGTASAGGGRPPGRHSPCGPGAVIGDRRRSAGTSPP
jgi:hypothetical protein